MLWHTSGTSLIPTFFRVCLSLGLSLHYLESLHLLMGKQKRSIMRWALFGTFKHKMAANCKAFVYKFSMPHSFYQLSVLHERCLILDVTGCQPCLDLIS